MTATRWEKDIALRTIQICMDCGLHKLYNNEDSKRNYHLWDWFDRNGLFDDGFTYHDGATKAVIMHDDLDDWVIKFRLPCEKADMDYCAKEYENYLAAKEAGLDYYFAATEYLCEMNGIVFYLQERVDCDESVDSTLADKLTERYSNDGENRSEDDIWYELDEMDAYERTMLLYGDEKLSNFIYQYRINDLHCGNFGIAGDHYVMIDFSGYGAGVFADPRK